MMSNQIFDILLILANIMMGLALIVSISHVFTLRAAEAHLVKAMAEAAKRKRMIDKLEKLRTSIIEEATINKKSQKDFVNLLDEALLQMREKERELILKGVNQPSAKGKRSYSFKLLSQTLKAT